MNKSAISIAVASTIVAPTVMAEYLLRVPLTDKSSRSLSTFSSKDVVYSDWKDVGGHYDCKAWSPSTDTVDFGSEFVQSRNCSQNQERLATPRDYDQFSDSYKERDDLAYTENRVVSEGETQSATGVRRDWNSFTSTFTDWEDYGSPLKHTVWTPAASAQTSNFQQTRDFKHPQEQFEQKREKDAVTQDIRDIGAPIRHTREDARSENRQVDVTSGDWYNTTTENFGAWSPSPSSQTSDFEQKRSFTQNQSRDWQYKADGSQIHARTENRKLTGEEQSRTVSTTVSSWSDTDRDSYSAWSPLATTQTQGFSQKRNYSQNQVRTWTYKADSEALGTRDETQTLSMQEESRSVSVDWTSWSNKGGHYDCDVWGPETNTIGHNVSFTQTRDCSQNQERIRSYEADGGVDLGSKTESKVITETESRPATGAGSWVSHESTFTNWVNEGGRYDYSSYSPSALAQTANFNQTRSYSQNQTRNEQLRERDTISGAIRNIGSPIKRDQTVGGSESRTITVTVGNWSNGSTSGHTAWSPAIASQTASFSQSRTYSQAQSRTWSYKAGASLVHSRVEGRTLSSQSESRSIDVSWSGWVDSGTHHTCGTWSPATNTVGYNVSFTQTRTCKQNQTRNRIYKSGGSVVDTKSESRTINENETRAATGVGSWTSHTSTFTSWANEGSAYDYGSYSPAVSTQTSSFGQSRSYKQNQYRMEQKRERDTISGAVRNSGSPIKRTQTLTLSQSRTVSVSVGGWSNGSTSNFTSWTPAPSSQTSTFTQSRTYSQSQSRVWSYTVGSTSVGSRTENRTLSNQSQSRSITVSWSGWVDSGGHYSCSAYSPDASTVNYGQSFTQTRSCKQNQTRNRVYKSGTTTISTKGESRTIDESSSRNATGTKDYITGTRTGSWSGWSNSGSVYSCSSYSPSHSSVNYGTTFTQTRSCSQNQTRSRTIYNVWAVRSDTVKTTESQSQTISVTQYRTGQTGTKNYITGTRTGSWSGWSNSGSLYSCSSWSPAHNTVNYGTTFTQTRSCSQNQTRSRTIYNVWANGSETVKATESGSQTISVSQSNPNQTGTKNYVTGSSYGAWGSWTNNGSITNCGAYSPAASTQTSSFYQVRGCYQPQVRYRDVYKTYADGSRVKTGTDSETRNYSVTSSRYVTVSAGSWYNSGSPYSCSGWSPSTSNYYTYETFTQTRSCSQGQRRTYSFSIGGSWTASRTISVTQSQSVKGTKVYYPPIDDECQKYYDKGMLCP